MILKEIFLDYEGDLHLVPKDLYEIYKNGNYSLYIEQSNYFNSSTVLQDELRLRKFSKFPIKFLNVSINRVTNLNYFFSTTTTVSKALTGGFIATYPRQGSIIIKLLQIIDFLPFIEIKVPAYYAYVLEYFDGELSDVFPNFFQYKLNDGKCEMNKTIASQNI